MLCTKKPLGFGTEKQVGEFFGIPLTEVRQHAASGEWPFYVIGGRRCFDVDDLLRIVAQRREVARA
jgi:hypothetical protein